MKINKVQYSNEEGIFRELELEENEFIECKLIFINNIKNKKAMSLITFQHPNGKVLESSGIYEDFMATTMIQGLFRLIENQE